MGRQRAPGRQRRALVVLGVINLIALSALVVLLLQAPAPGRMSASIGTLRTSPLDPQRLEACRQEASRALFNAGLTGIVQAQADGTILLQIQRRTTVTSSLASLRLDADAATWAALEAIAVASRGNCLDFDALQITVVLQPPDADGRTSTPARATARVTLSDLLLWSLGEIDDAELTLRLYYRPPESQ